MGSVERRQERERTPARRMRVPRAIWVGCVSEGASVESVEERWGGGTD